jgi:hypothetical protein
VVSATYPPLPYSRFFRQDTYKIQNSEWEQAMEPSRARKRNKKEKKEDEEEGGGGKR